MTTWIPASMRLTRWGRWLVVLTLATLALGAVGDQPAAAAPDVSRSDVLYTCEVSGGIYWESGGTYGCRMPGGLTIECDASGCLSWCYESRGCRCDLHGDDVICIHGFTSPDSGNPWEDAIRLDPYQEAKLPDTTEPETDPTGPVIEPDRVTDGTGAVTAREVPGTAPEGGTVIDPARAG